MRVLSLKKAGVFVVALLALASLTGCSGIPNNDQYQNTSKGRGGGWENFRAEASAMRIAA